MKKYKTREGGEVIIYTEESPVKGYPKIGVKKSRTGAWGIASWTEDGRYATDRTGDHPHDLVEVHPCANLKSGDKVVVWRHGAEGWPKLYLRFVGIRHNGEIVAEDGNGEPECWEFGEPA